MDHDHAQDNRLVKISVSEEGVEGDGTAGGRIARVTLCVVSKHILVQQIPPVSMGEAAVAGPRLSTGKGPTQGTGSLRIRRAATSQVGPRLLPPTPRSTKQVPLPAGQLVRRQDGTCRICRTLLILSACVEFGINWNVLGPTSSARHAASVSAASMPLCRVDPREIGRPGHQYCGCQQILMRQERCGALEKYMPVRKRG